jgi:hypothetical protein
MLSSLFNQQQEANVSSDGIDSQELKEVSKSAESVLPNSPWKHEQFR